MSLDYDQLFQQMAQLPEVKAAVKAKAEKLRKYMEIRWPEVNDVSDAQRKFLRSSPDQVILITEATGGSKRPVSIVTVRHSAAVAMQAKTGFVTKAVKDVS